MAPLSVEEIVRRNKEYAANVHTPIITIPEMIATGTLESFQNFTLIVTCVDPRCVPERFLGLTPEDGVGVLRNACGHIPLALNDILALDHLIKLSNVIIIHHTDCGASHFKTVNIRKELKERLPNNTDIDSMTFGDFEDLEQSVLEDVKFLKNSPLVRKELTENVHGFTWDLKTGLLKSLDV
ncbi:carbonic anhydrase [Xylariales sp. PMI_506]|nr:carbonic anhydrase [Xylariales sp. PMI_506]